MMVSGDILGTMMFSDDHFVWMPSRVLYSTGALSFTAWILFLNSHTFLSGRSSLQIPGEPKHRMESEA